MRCWRTSTWQQIIDQSKMDKRQTRIEASLKEIEAVLALATDPVTRRVLELAIQQRKDMLKCIPKME